MSIVLDHRLSTNAYEAEHGIIREAFEEIPEPYNINHFTVTNVFMVGGQRHHDFISPHFATVEQARDFKADALVSYPDCYVQCGTAYYRSEDDGNRLELLASIIPAQSQQA